MTQSTEKELYHLTSSLGQALHQTFSELQELRTHASSFQEEVLLLKLFNQTLKEENAVLRDRLQEIEKVVSVKTHEKSTSLQQQKQFFKKQQSKVAGVLQKALKELKKTKNNLEEIQTAHKLIQSEKNSTFYEEPIKICIEENTSLKQEYLQLLTLFLENSKNSDDQESLLPKAAVDEQVQEESLLALKQKHEAELAHLKSEFQAILQKNKQEISLVIQAKEKSIEKSLKQKFDAEKQLLLEKQEHFKQNVLVAHQKLTETVQQSKEQALLSQSLKSSLQERELELSELKASVHSLQQSLESSLLDAKDAKNVLKDEVTEWQEKYYTAQIRINNAESELARFSNLQEDYDKMRTLFSTIQSYMKHTPERDLSPPKPNESNLFSAPFPLKQDAFIKEDLFS